MRKVPLASFHHHFVSHYFKKPETLSVLSGVSFRSINGCTSGGGDVELSKSIAPNGRKGGLRSPKNEDDDSVESGKSSDLRQWWEI